MNNDKTVIMVNIVLATGIVVALLFGWWAGRLNRQLRRQNEQQRRRLAIEESVAEKNGDPDSLS